MNGEWVDVAVGDATMPVYVSRPEVRPRGAVIVLEEIFGVNEGIRNVANLLAGAGFLAAAPELFHRTDPHFSAGHDEEGFAKGRAAAMAVTIEQTTADLTATAGWIGANFPGLAIGTWGFCYGGSIAYFSATLPFVSAVVSFYGGAIAVGRTPESEGLVRVTPLIRAPLLLAFGGLDKGIRPEHIAKIREALTANAKAFEILIYADEDHAFFRHGIEGEGSTDGARAVWPRVAEFFGQHLNS